MPPAAPTVGGPAVGPRALAAALAATTVGVLPVFLATSMGVQVGADLGFDDSRLGLIMATFFGAAALGSMALGRFAERLGPTRALRVAALTSAVTMIAVAGAAHSLRDLMAIMAFGGVANALAQPAANLWLTRAVDASRLGLAFGLKQSAIPAAMLLGGLAVPVVAVPIGWRWAFAIGGGAAVGAAVEIGRHAGVAASTAIASRSAPGRTSALAVLAVSVGLGAAAAGTLGTYTVAAAVDAGAGESAAGLIFAVGATFGLVARLAYGARADRHATGQLGTVAALMAAGAASVLLLSGSVPVFAVAVPLVFSLGWGWPGLFNFSIARHWSHAPAAASGVTQTGTYTGAVLGPLVFGVVVDHRGYDSAWLVTSAAWLAAAAVVLVGRRLVRRSRPQMMEARPSQ